MKKRKKRRHHPAPAPAAAATPARSVPWRALLGRGFLFVVTSALCTAATATAFGNRTLVVATHAVATLVGGALRLCGEAVQVDGATLFSVTRPDLAICVAPECLGTGLATLYLAVVIAFPATLRRKIAGLAIGWPVLAAFNLARVFVLFLSKVHAPGSFDLLHEEIGSAASLGLTAVLAFIWAAGAVRELPSGHVTA